MNRLLLAGLAAALCACPSEPTPTSPLPSSSPALASPAPTAASSTLTVHAAGVAGAPDVPEASPDAPPKACQPWMGQPRCILGDHVLASAAAPAIKDAHLARTTAGNRARAALVGGNGAASGVEIVRVEPCGNATWALARTSLADVAAEKLPACDAGAFSAALAH